MNYKYILNNCIKNTKRCRTKCIFGYGYNKIKKIYIT